MYIVLCFGTVTDEENGKEYVEIYCIVINVKSYVANVNDCKPSNFQDN